MDKNMNFNGAVELDDTALDNVTGGTDCGAQYDIHEVMITNRCPFCNRSLDYFFGDTGTGYSAEAVKNDSDVLFMCPNDDFMISRGELRAAGYTMY